jgi:uncharacterized protein (TIGR03437 family)
MFPSSRAWPLKSAAAVLLIAAANLSAATVSLGSSAISVSGTRGPDTTTPPSYVTNPGAFGFSITDGTSIVSGEERRNTDPTGGPNLVLESMGSFNGTQISISGTITTLVVADSEGASGGHSQGFAIGLCTSGWVDQAAATYNLNLFATQIQPSPDGFSGIAFGFRNGSLYMVGYDYDSQPNQIFVDLGQAGLSSGQTLTQPITFSLAYSANSLAVTLNGTSYGSVTTSHDFSKALLIAMGASVDANNPQGTMTYSNLTSAPGAPMITGVVNGASFLPAISSGGWATVLGTNLAASSLIAGPADFNGNSLGTTLEGASVTVDSLPAFVYYVSPGQLNIIVPDDPNTGMVNVQVTTAGGVSNTFAVAKATVSPALFSFTNIYPAAVHANGTYLGPRNIIPGVTTQPAQPNETILLYGTGFGPTNPTVPAGDLNPNTAPMQLPVTATVGGLPAQVEGWLTGAGLYQLNLTVPNLPDGDASLVINVIGNSTQTGLLLSIAQ